MKKCQKIINDTTHGKIRCGKSMPCEEHNFIEYMEELKNYPPEWAGGSGDE